MKFGSRMVSLSPTRRFVYAGQPITEMFLFILRRTPVPDEENGLIVAGFLPLAQVARFLLF